MSAILQTLFGRRTELLEHLSAVDNLILVESKKYGSSMGMSGEGTMMNNNANDMGMQNNYYEPMRTRRPRDLSRRSNLLDILGKGGEEGMTVGEVKTQLRAIAGPDSVRNIDQTLVGLVKAGKLKSVSVAGERKRYMLP